MKCPKCRNGNAIKIYDSKYGFRGFGKDDKDVYACGICHSSFKIDRLNSEIILSSPINGKVGDKRIITILPLK